MSYTHDCGCSAETRDARTDDWGHTSPLSPQHADLREFQPAEPSQPLGTTRDQAARDAETDIWPTKKRVLLADVIALGLLSRAFAREASLPAADGMGLTSSLLARPAPSEPADASQPLGDVPASERPSEALPRPIEPEDVRVGLVVDIIDRARIRRVDDQRAWISDDEYTMLRRDGRSLWLVEDTPAPVDPDAAAIEAIVTAYRISPECSTHSVFGEAMLDHLRSQGFDVTPRAEQ